MSLLKSKYYFRKAMRALFNPLCLLASVFISTSSFAQMQIEISGVGQSLFPIAVTSFVAENNLPAKVTDVVRSDLANTGKFFNIDPGSTVQGISENPDLSFWTSRRAQALAIGDVKPLPGGMFEITYRLFDTVKKESLGGTTVQVNSQDLRRAGHAIADDIVQRLTGERGIFST